LGAAAGQRGRRQPIKQWQPLMMMTMLSWTAQKNIDIKQQIQNTHRSGCIKADD
jgi:hypothetical protein